MALLMLSARFPTTMAGFREFERAVGGRAATRVSDLVDRCKAAESRSEDLAFWRSARSSCMSSANTTDTPTAPSRAEPSAKSAATAPSAPVKFTAVGRP